MESQFFKSSKSVFMKKSVLTALIVVSTLFAARADNNFPVDKGKEAAITSLGITNGEMAFNIKCDNANADKISIVLSDDRGMVLYKEIIDSKNVNKTFRTSSEIGTVIVTVTNTKDKTKQKFEINNEKRFVEELVITTVH